jgi:cell wall-associated NlpC family hydrolase
LGTPYQWGGKAALGSKTDCSGLLQASAKANGIPLPRTTYDQYKVGQPVSLNQLQPGDAVFSDPTAQGPGHVSIYIGNGKVVEDPHTGAVVSVGALAGRKGIVGARRYG